MSCSLCDYSGWILPPPELKHTCSPIAMQCECRGGTAAMVSHLRESKNYQDHLLAKRIEMTFDQISPYEYKHGLKRPWCKCTGEPMPTDKPHFNTRSTERPFRADVDG